MLMVDVGGVFEVEVEGEVEFVIVAVEFMVLMAKSSAKPEIGYWLSVGGMSLMMLVFREAV